MRRVTAVEGEELASDSGEEYVIPQGKCWVENDNAKACPQVRARLWTRPGPWGASLGEPLLALACGPSPCGPSPLGTACAHTGGPNLGLFF